MRLGRWEVRWAWSVWRNAHNELFFGYFRSKSYPMASRLRGYTMRWIGPLELYRYDD